MCFNVAGSAEKIPTIMNKSINRRWRLRMPSMKWSERTGLEIGRYAEYYAKMEFTSYGFEVFTSELADHGVDFIAHHPKDDTYIL